MPSRIRYLALAVLAAIVLASVGLMSNTTPGTPTAPAGQTVTFTLGAAGDTGAITYSCDANVDVCRETTVTPNRDTWTVNIDVPKYTAVQLRVADTVDPDPPRCWISRGPVVLYQDEVDNASPARARGVLCSVTYGGW